MYNAILGEQTKLYEFVSFYEQRIFTIKWQQAHGDTHKNKQTQKRKAAKYKQHFLDISEFRAWTFYRVAHKL